MLAQDYESEKDRPAAPAGKAATLNQAVTWVFAHVAEEMPPPLAPKVAEVRAALADGVIGEIWIWYVHNLPESDNVKKELKAIASSVSSAVTASYPELKPDIHVEEVGRFTLAQWYESSRTPILVGDEIKVPVDDSCLSVEGPEWTAYTVTVTAEWLNSIYWTYKERLFSANVRGFLGSRKSKDNINNGMRETLDAEPGRFQSVIATRAASSISA